MQLARSFWTLSFVDASLTLCRLQQELVERCWRNRLFTAKIRLHSRLDLWWYQYLTPVSE
jgi:hypothetical protein